MNTHLDYNAPDYWFFFCGTEILCEAVIIGYILQQVILNWKGI